ncbi:20407_t:CDS:2, partial [Gigaspora margarita]
MSTSKCNYEIYCEYNESDLLKNKTSSKKLKKQTIQKPKPIFSKNTGIIVISDNENKLPSLKTKSTESNNSISKIIDISDSDEDELPSLETVLKNITKFPGYKKINNIEFIEIQDDTTAANNNKDDFTYTINDVRFLRISKKTIRSKLKYMVRRLKSKKAIRYIAEICKHKERYNSWILWNERVHANVQAFDEKHHRVIIPELGVMFIMTDLKVNDYDTAVIIM